jgi:hypothetical protein
VSVALRSGWIDSTAQEADQGEANPGRRATDAVIG